MAKYGLDYESVKRVNPSIVYCSLSGFGQFGRYSNQPGHGYNMESFAGTINLDVAEDGTPFVSPASYDVPASSMAGYAAALGIVSGVLRKWRSGIGCYIDTSVWDCGIGGFAIPSTLAALDWTPIPGYASRATPKYAPYRTRDEKYLMVCAMEHKYWISFCEAIGHPELIDVYEDSHADDWGERHPELYGPLAEAIARRTLAEWEDIFLKLSVPVTPFFTRAEALASEHAADRGILVAGRAGGRRLPDKFIGSPLVIDGQRGLEQNYVSELGEDTSEILKWVGYSDEEINGLYVRDCVRGTTL
jgi:crotonobetainyl-CoA:carnitine CoA-transferase CaiB-like acyl-CoA transferase